MDIDLWSEVRPCVVGAAHGTSANSLSVAFVLSGVARP